MYVLEPDGGFAWNEVEQPKRRISVQKDDLIGNGDTFTFFADHWHEHPDGALEIVDCTEVIASFRPHRWHHVYFVDSVEHIEPKKSRK